MHMAQIEIIMIASVVAASCSLIGTFLVLRKMALMSDAISHAILFGIVIMFFLTGSRASLPMLLAATATGVLTVYLVELLVQTRLVKEDAAIGLVFPALFSLAVILISLYAGNVHLDTDAVLLGELVFAPFDRLSVAGRDIGPKGLWLGLSVGLLNLAFILLFYKELKLATFDAGLAATLGFSPVLIHYVLMTLVSITAVSSFEAVGSVLVVALMIGPPAAAYLLTDRLPVMLALGVLLAVVAAVLGYLTAYLLNGSIAGSMATMTGVIFLIVLMVAPERGLIRRWSRQRRQRLRFAAEALVVHLSNHMATPEFEEACTVAHLTDHFRWSERFAAQIVRFTRQRDWIREMGGRLRPTSTGIQVASQVMTRS